MTRPTHEPRGVAVAATARRAEVDAHERTLVTARRELADAETALGFADEQLAAAQQSQRDGHTAAGTRSVDRLLHWRRALADAVERAVAARADVVARIGRLRADVAAAEEALQASRASLRALEIALERRADEARREQDRRRDDA